MDWSVDLFVLAHILGGAALGLIIGYERSYHGRAAGMRTYALVAMSTTLLTLVTSLPHSWVPAFAQATGSADPTRVIQGILTGIGFLGSGVILKEGLSIRGLSTSASIWMTATIGIVFGLGFYLVAVAATVVMVAVMSEFRFIETMLPHQIIVHLDLAFAVDRAPDSAALRERMRRYGFEVSNYSIHADVQAGRLEFALSLRAVGRNNADVLAADLAKDGDLRDYRLTPERN